MAQYKKAVMTDAGTALMTKAYSGQCKIKFTRMVTGNGIYSEKESTIDALEKIAALKSQKQSFLPAGIEVNTENSVTLTFNITNCNEEQVLEEGYYIQEIGLYAQEDGVAGSEILYSIVVAAEADYLVPYNGYNPVIIIQKYSTIVSNAMEVTIEESSYSLDILTSHIKNESNPHGITAEQINAIPTDEKGKAGGVATLDDNGKVSKEQLPVPTNDLLATEAGTALDAVQGKRLDDKGVQIALYVGTDNCLHFRDWEGNDSIIPISLIVPDVEHKAVTFGGTGTTRTITTGGRLPLLVAQYSEGDKEKSSLYYDGTIIRKNNLTSVSPNGITIQSPWDEAHDFHCYIAYEGAEIEVESVTFGGVHTTRTIPLKKQPKLIVQVSNVPGYNGVVAVWCNGHTRSTSGSIASVTDTEITIISGWSISYTFTCYIVY